jgi:nucleoporin POM152
LTDGGGNTVDLLSASATSTTKRSITVLGRSSASFWGCGTGTAKTVDLLHGKEGRVTVVLNSSDPADGPWVVTLRFDPERRDKQSRKASSGWTKDFTIPQDRKSINVPVSEPGEYSIVRIKGKTCPGEILSPETCLVVEQPKPSAEIGFKSLHEWWVSITLRVKFVLIYNLTQFERYWGFSEPGASWDPPIRIVLHNEA